MDDKNIYQWYDTNIARFLYKYPLPIKVEEAYKNDIIRFIKEYSNEYLSDYESIVLNGGIKGFGESEYAALYNQKSAIQDIFDQICTALSFVENSQWANAESVINEMMNDAEENLLVLSLKDLAAAELTFYRVRVIKGKSASQIRKNDLFHIPYHLRYLASNERFSIAGHPCLYMSTNLNIAWNECNTPNDFYYSVFSYDYAKDLQDPWKYLILLNPQTILKIMRPLKENDSLEFIRKYLRTFPIILACSFICSKKGAPYKPEYMFSQLIMQWIHRNTYRVKGAVYESCTDKFTLKYAGYNIAIPATDFDNNGYSKTLRKRFSWCKPIQRKNEFSTDNKKFIAGFLNDVSNFKYFQPELDGCISELQLLANHIFTVAEKAETLDSDVLMVLIENTYHRMVSFKEKHSINKLVAKCRNSKTYKKKYEEEYVTLDKLLRDFYYIIDILQDMETYIEHGFA